MKKRWIVILNLGKLTDTEKIEKSKEVYASMGGNAYFPSPLPPLADFNGQIIKTELSYLNSRDAGKTETDIFHNDMDELERMMLSLGNYVEIIANEHDDTGDEVIHSAAMEVKADVERDVQNLAVKNAAVKGTVKATMKAQAPRTIYLWDSRKKGTSAWIRAAETSQAKYTYIGLTSADTYEFRGGYILINGDKIYFDPIELVIL